MSPIAARDLSALEVLAATCGEGLLVTMESLAAADRKLGSDEVVVWHERNAGEPLRSIAQTAGLTPDVTSKLSAKVAGELGTASDLCASAAREIDRSRRRVAVLVLAADEESAQRIRTRLCERYNPLVVTSCSEVIAWADRLRVAVVCLDAIADGVSRSLVAEIRQQLRCPVLMVGVDGDRRD